MAVVACLTGGLGNQLFQYAMGFSVAKMNDDIFYVDVSQFEHGKRKYVLNCFNITANILDIKPAKNNTKIERFFARVRRLNATGLFTTKFLQEDPDKIYDYAYTNIKYKHNVYLNGFWQSWRYFNDYRELLLNELSLKCNINFGGGYGTFVNKVRNEESVAVHIRRGDYIECDGWLINPQFYIKAIEYIKDQVQGDLKFYVFCEDKFFAKKLLRNMDFQIVTGNYGLSDVEEFSVMSSCKHKIISNSSFSWWAAYLGKQDNACIIAPVFKQWKREFYLPGWKTFDLNERNN